MTKSSFHYLFPAAIIAATLSVTSCTTDANDNYMGNWVKCESYFPGTTRGGAACFIIGENDADPESNPYYGAYVGTGFTYMESDYKSHFRDLYRFDGHSWKQLTSMPDEAGTRCMGVGFSINGKGYIGLGYDGTYYKNDFWCYDPETDSWSQAPSLPRREGAEKYDSAEFRRDAVAFVIDNVAYVGGGRDVDGNILADFYKFDGTSWSRIANIGVPRRNASSFVYGGKGYVLGGIYSGCPFEFQRYNPETDKWESLRHIADRTDYDFDDEYTLAAAGCVTFKLNEKYYLATGGASSSGVATWEYHPDDDIWIQKTNFEGSARRYAIGFTLIVDGEETGFVVTGQGSEKIFYSDMWKFNPYQQYEDKD